MIRVLLSALLSLQLRLSSLVTRRPEIWDRARQALSLINRHIPLAPFIGLTLRLLVGGMACGLASSPRWGQDRDRSLGD
jgi:hypothetical protein